MFERTYDANAMFTYANIANKYRSVRSFNDIENKTFDPIINFINSCINLNAHRGLYHFSLYDIDLPGQLRSAITSHYERFHYFVEWQTPTILHISWEESNV